VKNVGVIGAGVMGSGIAQLFVNKKYNVALKDVDQARVDAGVQFIQGEFDKVIKRKRATAEDVKKKMSLLRPGTDDSVFNETDVIIEAAVEIMDIKKKIVQGLEDKKVLDGKKSFATNTSSLSVTDLQSVSKFPDKVVGMHFFNPVAKMPLVEVIVGDKTSKETAAAIYNLALKTGKKPIIVKDAPGFVVNRVLGVYMAEAGRLVEDGADPIKVEQAILNFGLPMGPFGLLDMVGLDVACHVGPVLEKGLKSKRFSTHPKIREMMEQGYLGKKVRKGFYRYDEKGKELGIDATVVAKYLTTSPDSTFPAADIVDRCILLMVNEAAMILGEGVAATPEDVDTGMVWGTGFAPFRGGLLQYADHRGIQAIVDRLTQLQNKHKDDRFAPAPLLKEMAAKKTRFFPNRPFVPYVERVGFPTVNV
jgi:3-hydroxyacyl-CoA dehydrogenase